MKNAYSMLVMAYCLTLAPPSSALAGTITFAPPNQTVLPGNPVTISIVATNSGSSRIGDYDLTINFTASLLSAPIISFGTLLGGPLNAIQSATVGAGFVEIAEVSLLNPAALTALQPATFTLATITFSSAHLNGTSPLTFSNVQIDDVNGLPLSTTTTSGSVSLTAVPEPSSLAILSLGLISAGLWRCSRSIRKSARGNTHNGASDLPLDIN